MMQIAYDKFVFNVNDDDDANVSSRPPPELAAKSESFSCI